MNKNRIVFITLFILLPVSASAHGEEILTTLFLDGFILLSGFVFIPLLKWKTSGKLLLLFLLLLSVVLVFSLTGNMSYMKNIRLINTLSAVVPIVSVMIAFFVFRRRFEK